MDAVERINIEPIEKLLRMAAPAKATDLESLFARLSPICELNRTEERILFQANSDQNLIRIGTKCTLRLQAHSFAAGVIFAGVFKPGFINLTGAEEARLFKPADDLFTWAVGRDLREWMKQSNGSEPDLERIFPGANADLPGSVLSSLSSNQLLLGECFFRLASAFILLHEIAHLNFAHWREHGFWSIQQEKDADRFAADWLIEGAANKDEDTQASQLNVLFGISIALLWLTVFNAFLGPSKNDTHPQGYDRLFQVLDHGIEQMDDDENQMVWYFVWKMLFRHMWAAGFDFSETDVAQSQGDQRQKVSYLIDRISRQDRKR